MGFALQGETHVAFISHGKLPADLLLKTVCFGQPTPLIDTERIIDRFICL